MSSGNGRLLSIPIKIRYKMARTKVGDAMTPCKKLKCSSPDELAVDALMKMSKQDLGRLPVQELHATQVRIESRGTQQWYM